MTRFRYDTATSFNGWIADEAHSLEWLFAVEGGTNPDAQLYPVSAPVLVQGASTYLWVLEHENLLQQPEKWGDFFGDKHVFVFTHRKLPVPHGASVQFLQGAVAETIDQLKQAAAGGDVWIVGGGELAAQFLDAGVLDEIALSVAPVALAGGAPLFPRRVDAKNLRLISAQAVGQFARLTYEIRR